MQNNIFSSALSSSNPFNLGGSNTNALDGSLAETYAKIEALKNRQNQLNTAYQQASTGQIPTTQNKKATVFTEIADELNNLSDDEIAFVVNSEKYQILNAKYQNEFSQFLINKFANEYLQTSDSRTLEELLATIKTEKEKYKGKFAKDLTAVKNQNQDLLEKNRELEERLAAIQAQLQKEGKNE